MMARLDLRLCCLIVAVLAALAGLFDPQVAVRRQASDLLLVIDITGSMMVRDYAGADAGISRLARSKAAATRLIGELHCGSRAGVAIFSERQPFLLLAPMETCANYAPLTGTIAALDWRMAWEGDSFIARGLIGAVKLADAFEADAVFFSDGHEAPPLPLGASLPGLGERERPPSGVIVGVGNPQPSPIPRFDDDGRESGVWRADEVIQENRVGLPPPEVQQRDGYEPRNAPWGSAAAVGEEHLSGLREEYLQSLAAGTGLGYVRLDSDQAVLRAIERHARQRPVSAQVSLAPWLAATVLLAMLIFCLASRWPRRQTGILPAPGIRVPLRVVERSPA